MERVVLFSYQAGLFGLAGSSHDPRHEQRPMVDVQEHE
jgi:hypothetical protein